MIPRIGCAFCCFFFKWSMYMLLFVGILKVEGDRAVPFYYVPGQVAT